MDDRFRNSHRYALAHGYVSGYSTLEQGLVADGQLEYQAVLIPGAHAVMQSVKARDLEYPTFNNIGDMFRAAHRYAAGMGFATGFPAFEQGIDIDGEVVFGTTLLRSTVVDVRSVRASELGSPAFGDIQGMAIAVHRYARALGKGYVSGFPLFEQGLRGGVLHYGIALINSNASFRLVLADAIGIFDRFSFDPSISESQKNKLLERHSFAISRITACGNLTKDEKDKLRLAYRKNIKHGSSTLPGVNAYVPFSGPDARRRINVNFGVLFPQRDVEIAQTLIHEMMHCAGYDHPDRRVPPAGRTCTTPNPALFDCPMDGGPYYGSPPLKAEICIAGSQSLVDGTHRDCERTVDGYAVVGQSERRNTLEQLDLERIPDAESEGKSEV